jgi:hypothetical protein
MNFFDPPSDPRPHLRQRLLQFVCAGGQTLEQIMQTLEISRMDLAEWMDDPLFRRQMAVAKKRARQIDRLERDMHRSACIARQSRLLQEQEQVHSAEPEVEVEVEPTTEPEAATELAPEAVPQPLQQSDHTPEQQPQADAEVPQPPDAPADDSADRQAPTPPRAGIRHPHLSEPHRSIDPDDTS